MTTVVAVLIVVAIALIAVSLIRSGDGLAVRGRDDVEADDGGSDIRWLSEARDVITAGRQLVAAADATPHTTAEQQLTIASLSTYSHRVAALTTDAPTAMDARVCRNVAVRVHALAEHVDHADDLELTRADEDTDRLVDELARSLTDLEQQVELL